MKDYVANVTVYECESVAELFHAALASWAKGHSTISCDDPTIGGIGFLDLSDRTRYVVIVPAKGITSREYGFDDLLPRLAVTDMLGRDNLEAKLNAGKQREPGEEG